MTQHKTSYTLPRCAYCGEKLVLVQTTEKKYMLECRGSVCPVIFETKKYKKIIQAIRASKVIDKYRCINVNSR